MRIAVRTWKGGKTGIKPPRARPNATSPGGRGSGSADNRGTPAPRRLARFPDFALDKAAGCWHNLPPSIHTGTGGTGSSQRAGTAPRRHEVGAMGRTVRSMLVLMLLGGCASNPVI